MPYQAACDTNAPHAPCLRKISPMKSSCSMCTMCMQLQQGSHTLEEMDMHVNNIVLATRCFRCQRAIGCKNTWT